MTALQQASATHSVDQTRPSVATRSLVIVGTILVIVAVAIVPLLSSLFIHPTLDAASAADRLGVTAAQAHALSDASVGELVLGPGTFAFSGPDGTPFYDSDERGHLRDARLLLYLAFGVGLVAAGLIAATLVRATGLARASLWGAIAQGGGISVIAVVVLGILALVAFSTLFTLFHQLFFPGGNFSFDPRTQHLVQLYPFTFWQITSAAFGVIIAMLGAGTWLVARRLTRRPSGGRPS